MPSRYKLITTLLIIALTVVAILGYKYIYLDSLIRDANKQLYAPADYQGFSLDKTPLQNMVLSYSDQEVIISQATIKTWYEPYVRSYTGQPAIRAAASIITVYLQELSAKTDTKPVNARLDYRDGRIIEFDYPQKGHVLDIGSSYANIVSAMASKQQSTELVFKDVDPEVTIDKINNLGITTLLGRGESNFQGSSSARIHNIKTGAALFNNILIAPDEEFSFNRILGDVDAVSGYLPELVIKYNGLAKEYGGCICQVSTTMFRAAIYAGLPITERKPHSFPVKYYNPQGFDSTIYPGVTDLKFTNDTGHNILVQTRVTGTKLSFIFYGSENSRKVVVNAPVQYDIQTSGAMKAYFTREITLADGTTAKETFRSTYKSPTLFPTLHNPLE